MSPGFGGVTVAEVAHALYPEPARPPLLAYVGGLGGKEVGEAEFDRIVADLREAAATGVAPPPRLLFTAADARQVDAMLRLAGKEVPA